MAEAEGYDPQRHIETFPESSKVTFKFPARGQRPPVTMYWYDGDRYKPPRYDEIPDPGWVPGKAVGALVVGDKASITYGSHGARGWRILDDDKMSEYMGGRKVDWEQNVPGLPDNVAHLDDWLKACKGYEPAGSNFDYGGPLTEVAAIGDIALRLLGTELRWDSKHLIFPDNPEASRYVHTPYREGWRL